MKNSFNILHITDIHIGQSKEKYRENDDSSIFRNLDNACKNIKKCDDTIDFIIITGDISERDISDKEKIEQNIKNFFDHLQSKLVAPLKISPERVLVVPGNHEFGVMDYFISACNEKKYSTVSKSGNDCLVKPLHVTFESEFNIGFTLFNSYCPKQEDNKKYIPLINPQDLKEIEEELLNSEIPLARIALFHHHLLPLPAEAENQFPLDSTDILKNASQMLSWLMKNNYIAVLHGHKHRSYFSKYVVHNFNKDEDKEQEINIISGGSFGSKNIPSGVRNGYKIITVNTEPDLLNPTIIVKRFFLDNEESLHSQYVSSPTASSEPPRSKFEKELYNKECFLSSNFHVHYDYQESEKYFWKDITPEKIHIGHGSGDCYSFFKKEEGCLIVNDMQTKRSALSNLVDIIRKSNRNNGVVFRALTCQLDNIYTFGSLFFDNKEAEQIAINEFAGQEHTFSNFINAIKWQPTYKKREYSHLDWANVIIGNEIFEHFKHKEKKISLLEAGYGGLCTLVNIAQKLQQGKLEIEYFGIDVAESLSNKCKELYNERENTNYLYPLLNVKPFRSFELFNSGNVTDVVTVGGSLGVSELKGSFDCFVSSYCFHHIPSPKKLLEVTANGVLPRYFFCENDPGILWKSIHEGTILTNYILESKRTEFTRIARDSFMNQGKKQANYFTIRSELSKCLINHQDETIKGIKRLLTDDGLFIIADPNGYSSSFNRSIIFEDPDIAVSYFNEFTETARMLENNNFLIKSIYRQVKLRNGVVTNIEMNLDWLREDQSNDDFTRRCADIFPHDNWSRKKSSKYRSESRNKNDDILPLDYEDLHLGYIIVAQKLGGEIRDQKSIFSQRSNVV